MGPAGATGPTGAKGVQGNEGPEGPPGEPGSPLLEDRSEEGEVPKETTAFGFTVLCAPGHKATGGGYTLPVTTSNLLQATNSAPALPEGNGWAVAITNETAFPAKVKIWAVCES